MGYKHGDNKMKHINFGDTINGGRNEVFNPMYRIHGDISDNIELSENDIILTAIEDNKKVNIIKFEDEKLPYKNIIEARIIDPDGNVVREERYENTDSLVARCIVWNTSSSHPWDYLTMLVSFEDPPTVLGLPDNTEAYKYMKTNYDALLSFNDYLTNSFSRVNDYVINSYLQWTNTGATRNIYMVASYYNNRQIMFTYYIIDPHLEVPTNYQLQLKYFIYIDKYIAYDSALLSTSRNDYDNTNSVVNVFVDDTTRAYKYSRAFAKAKPYQGLDTSDYASTITAPKMEITSDREDWRADIFSNQYSDPTDSILTGEIYFRFMNDGDVGNTNALAYFMMEGTAEYHYPDGHQYYATGFYVMQFSYIANKSMRATYIDMIRSDYTNSFKIDFINGYNGSSARIITGHIDKESGNFTHTGESISIYPIKRNITDIPLPDNINIIKEYVKTLSGPAINYKDCINYGYDRGSDYLGIFNEPLYWSPFFENISDKLKYLLNWKSGDNPYLYIVSAYQINSATFDGDAPSTSIDPYYSDTDFYIYKITLSDHWDISGKTSGYLELHFSGISDYHLKYIFCYESNCFVVCCEGDRYIQSSNYDYVITNERAFTVRNFSPNPYPIQTYMYMYTIDKLTNQVITLYDNMTIDGYLDYYHDNYYYYSYYTKYKLYNKSLLTQSGNILDYNTIYNIKDQNGNLKYILDTSGAYIYDVDNDWHYIFSGNFIDIDGDHKYVYYFDGWPHNWHWTVSRFLHVKIFNLMFNTSDNIILPFAVPINMFTCCGIRADSHYYNNATDNLNNLNLDNCRDDILNTPINLGGKQFYLSIPIEENVKLGKLNIHFENAQASPTFGEGEYLAIPICDGILLTDSLEKWRVFTITGYKPADENSLYNFVDDYVSNYLDITLDIKDNNRTNYNTWFSYWNDYTFATMTYIDIPDEQYNAWNTYYMNKDNLKYRGIYMVEDTFKYDNNKDLPSLVIFYPRTISTSSGDKEIEPSLVLLNNSIECEFIHEHDPSTDGVNNIGYIKVILSGHRMFEDVFWYQKNNFLLYVYFKEVGTSDFVRQFDLPLCHDYKWYKALCTTRNDSFLYGVRTYNYYNDSSNSTTPEEMFTYLLDFKEYSEITHVVDRNNIVKWKTLQYPMCRKYVDAVNVVTFGDDEQTVYEWMNVQPNDGSNQIVPKTFYLDVEDFGETNFDVITNNKDTDRNIAVYFCWPYGPENRSGNDITNMNPIIDISDIRQVIGDNFKVYDINDNEIGYYFVNDKKYWPGTDNVSSTPTDYILLNAFSTSNIRDYQSGYTDNTANNNENRVSFRYSYNWDIKNWHNFSTREHRDPNYSILYPMNDYDYVSMPYNVAVSNSDVTLFTDFLDIFWHINPVSFIHDWYNNPGSNQSTWVGRPHPSPGFLPSYWFDTILRYNPPTIDGGMVVIKPFSSQSNLSGSATVFGKIVDIQQNIDLQDTTERVKVIVQTNRKLTKSDIKYIHSVGVHELNKHYAQGSYDKDGNDIHSNGLGIYEKHMVRYIVAIENSAGTSVKFYTYDRVYNKWIDITANLSNNEDYINYGLSKFDLELYGHKLNDLVRNIMNDSDKLFFVVAMRNTSGDEYGFVEFYGISLEIEFNDDSLYREIPWTWIKMSDHTLVDDITGLAQDEVTIGFKTVPTHWVKFETSTTATSQSNSFTYNDRFFQIPVTVYMVHDPKYSAKRYPDGNSSYYYLQNEHRQDYLDTRVLYE